MVKMLTNAEKQNEKAKYKLPYILNNNNPTKLDGITFGIISDAEIQKQINDNKYCMEQYGMNQFDYALSKQPYGQYIKLTLDSIRSECSRYVNVLPPIDVTTFNGKSKLENILTEINITELCQNLEELQF